MRRIMVLFGTRPEAIKLAPVILALRGDPAFEVAAVTTAQHRRMLDQVLDLFGIEPDVDLNGFTPGQTLADVTKRALVGLEPVLGRHLPDAVLVQGDTTTAFVGALVAFYQRVPVVHLEAGLRTGDLRSPFPEEGNRRLIGQLTSLHLAATPDSRDNLLAEGVDDASIVITGNTVIDALLWAVDRSSDYGDPALKDLDEDSRPVLLVTAHRRESWGAPMRQIGQALAELAVAEPDLHVVVPLHLNPTVRNDILPAIAWRPNVTVIDPLDYAGFSKLMQRSSLILSDSGGVQEEGPSLGKPILVMRDATERPEGIAAGTARLVGTKPSAIVHHVRNLLHDKAAYARMARAANPYGDGKATERSVSAIAHFFGEGPPAQPFEPETPASVRPSPQDATAQ